MWAMRVGLPQAQLLRQLLRAFNYTGSFPTNYQTTFIVQTVRLDHLSASQVLCYSLLSFGRTVRFGLIGFHDPS